MWWNATTADGYDGECRRYPPRNDRDDTEDVLIGMFPFIAADLWCGEHHPKEATDDDTRG